MASKNATKSKSGSGTDGSATVDLYYLAAGRGSKVIFTPVQAPKLRNTEKNSVFKFLRQYDQYLELIQDRRLAGELINPVELIRCLAPGLYNFLKDYVLEPTATKVEAYIR